MTGRGSAVPQRRDAPDTPRGKVVRATEMIVAVRRQLGHDDAAVRAGVLGDVKEALAGDAPWVRHVPLEGASEPGPYATLPGVYRLVLDHFGMDRADLRLQETVFAWVQAALDGSLGGAGDGDRGVPGG